MTLRHLVELAILMHLLQVGAVGWLVYRLEALERRQQTRHVDLSRGPMR